MFTKAGRLLTTLALALLLAGCDKCTDLLSPFRDRAQSGPQSCREDARPQ